MQWHGLVMAAGTCFSLARAAAACCGSPLCSLPPRRPCLRGTSRMGFEGSGPCLRPCQHQLLLLQGQGLELRRHSLLALVHQSEGAGWGL